MDTGRDFLRAQVSNCVMQHRTLVENLEDHQRSAKDSRYAELCARYLPRMKEHQRLIEEYRATLGEASGEGAKEVLGFALGKARDFADLFRTSDFLRVVGDIVTIRQSQDTFATFAAAGDQIGEPRLAELGRMCEQDHDQMQRDFNNYIQQLFVEKARGSGA